MRENIINETSNSKYVLKQMIYPTTNNQYKEGI